MDDLATPNGEGGSACGLLTDREDGASTNLQLVGTDPAPDPDQELANLLGVDAASDLDREFSTAALAKLLGLNAATVRNWVTTNRLQARREGRRHMIRAEDVLTFLRENRSLGNAHRSRRAERADRERADRVRREQVHDNGATFRPSESSIVL